MEITFYNKTGHPQIYLSVENENSFYTWDGHAVAYVYDDKIYGWKGKDIQDTHLIQNLLLVHRIQTRI